MKVKYKTILLSSLLLLFMPTVPAVACGCPGSAPGPCYICQGSVWVYISSCGSGCPACYSCVNCWCTYICDPSLCQTCVGSTCKVCGGDTNKICCNGECREKCKNGPPTGHCGTSHNEDYLCPGCAGLILGPHCMDITFREYTGNINHSCSGGCDGDCERKPDVLCYTVYLCREEFMRPGVCGVVEGAPGGVACRYSDPYVFCVPCKKDTSYPGEDVYVLHHACR